MRKTAWVLMAILGAGAIAIPACSGDDENGVAGNGGFGATSSGGSGAAAASGGSGGDSGSFLDVSTGGSGGECSSSVPCEAGVCVAGQCCPSVDQVCGEQCCQSGEVCLFEQCVVPGKICQSAADCDSGQYCETGLGEPTTADAGTIDSGAGGDAGTRICTQPVPANGRCVDLPPVCGEGGMPDGGSCIENCEYRPPVGNLEATLKWQWGQNPTPTEYTNNADVWSTPTVGRLYDANCDGKVDESDPPNVVFVSGNAEGSQCADQNLSVWRCQYGVLRMLDGRSGQEIWSLRRAETGSTGFAGMSVAIGDMDGDERMDIVAMTGEGKPVIIDGDGTVLAIADTVAAEAGVRNFGWGGGLAVADMDGDGNPEIAYGSSLYTTSKSPLAITQLFVGSGPLGGGGGRTRALSYMVDVDGDGFLELVAGNMAYRMNGQAVWDRTDLPNGYNATADFDGDGKPEVVMIANPAADPKSAPTQAWILEAETGNTELGPVSLTGVGIGGPPTVADFDGDGEAEIGVATQDVYVMLEPNYSTSTIDIGWTAPNHDFSSSVTGSSVFDFEGDGKAEVVYNDECFLWVYDGETGAVRLALLTTSFTATEASLVADVDGDGHSEILLISNGADPSRWTCNVAPWNQPDPANNRPAWEPPPGETVYRGIRVYGDRESSWVGTRTLWNQHAYHVTNVCDSRDSACDAPNVYGSIPADEKDNWNVSWLNNFRQNVQDQGIFDAPDATVSVKATCTNPVSLEVSVRNIGLAGLPAGVRVDVFALVGGSETPLVTLTTSRALLPGQTEVFYYQVAPGAATSDDLFGARIVVDPNNRTFNECREDNNESTQVGVRCGPA